MGQTGLQYGLDFGGRGGDAPESLSLCVLSSSSAGNCTALVRTRGAEKSLYLLDLGLSPRRTLRHLDEVGLGGVPISGVLLTHLDADHCHAGWIGKVPAGATLHVHRRHRSRAARAGFLHQRTEVFERDFELEAGLVVRPIVMSHDELGVAAFRIEHEDGSRKRSLGFATDVGRATEELVRHLSGVDTLAIESNYCPRLQRASGRPEFLTRRIMGGSGHLSNAECAEAVQLISPKERVVLLHLSRQCNTRELAEAGHAGRGYGLTVAAHDGPTEWIGVGMEKKACAGLEAPHPAR